LLCFLRLCAPSRDISARSDRRLLVPLKDYTVVVFSDDPQYWTLPFTRWVNGTRPDQEGRFRVRNLPAGSYNIVAVDYIEAGAWGDPELLDRLKSHAKRITLSDGGSEKVDLKLVEQY
jgi:hypothetical protein